MQCWSYLSDIKLWKNFAKKIQLVLRWATLRLQNFCLLQIFISIFTSLQREKTQKIKNSNILFAFNRRMKRWEGGESFSWFRFHWTKLNPTPKFEREVKIIWKVLILLFSIYFVLSFIAQSFVISSDSVIEKFQSFKDYIFKIQKYDNGSFSIFTLKVFRKLISKFLDPIRNDEVKARSIQF